MAAIDDEGGSPRFPLAGCLSLLLIVVAALAAVYFWRYWPESGSGHDPNAQPRPVSARGDLAPLEKANIEIYETVSPSLVQVTNLEQAAGSGLGTLNVQEVPRGVGSGFVWDSDGHIVTNYHVVQGADAARVTLSDHTTVSARQAWTYPDQDIAVLWLQVPKRKLHPIMIGRAADLKVGQITYALGDPFGLDQTMTNGIVSALGREIQSANGRTIRGVIQTSAAINPGNSGGPLLDSAGRLIGMNTAILSPSGTFAGIGFAIPVDEINRIVPQLIAHGKVVQPRLGVQLAPDQMAQRLGVDQGALVIRVIPNSPAAKAGLRGTQQQKSGHIVLGDIIMAIDGTPIKNADDLYNELQKHKIGDVVTLTIVREEKQQDVRVTLEPLE
jgi:S1-C subfamily serine protease